MNQYSEVEFFERRFTIFKYRALRSKELDIVIMSTTFINNDS